MFVKEEQSELVFKQSAPPHKKGLFSRLWAQRELQLMVVPFIILVIIFSYIPIYGIIMAFQNYQLGDAVGFSRWVGFEHFRQFLSDPNFWRVLKNTFGISLLKLLIACPAPILFAIMLNEVRHGRYMKTIQTISYMPHFLSWVVVAGLFFELLSIDDGIVNQLLISLGITAEPLMFLGKAQYFWPIVVTTDVWKEMGFNSIIYIAAIAGIDPTLYEAADMDGAGRFRKIWHITLACIKSTIVIIFIIDISNIVSAGFDQIMPLTNNLKNTMVNSAAEIIDTYVYKMGIQLWRTSFATAIGVFKSLLSITLLFMANTFAKVLGEDSLW